MVVIICHEVNRVPELGFLLLISRFKMTMEVHSSCGLNRRIGGGGYIELKGWNVGWVVCSRFTALSAHILRSFQRISMLTLPQTN